MTHYIADVEVVYSDLGSVPKGKTYLQGKSLYGTLN